MPKKSGKARNEKELTDEAMMRKSKCEQALRKNAEPKFWDKWGEPIACGFIGFLFMSMIYYSWTSDRRKLADISVNDEVRINFINNQDLGFTLAHNGFFEGRNLKEVQELSNNLLAQDKKFGKCTFSSEESKVVLEESYNFYDRFPDCRSKSQISFGVSLGYAEAVSAVYEERNCARSSGGSHFSPSVNYMKSCDKNNMGAKGGSLKETLQFLKENGSVDSECFDKLDLGNEECATAKDLDGCDKKSLKDYCMLDGVSTIKREIALNGPVLGVIPAYLNFLTFKSGLLVIEENSRKVTGHLSVKIVGWKNFESGEAWIVDPLFGNEYGDNGYAYVSMDHNEEFGTVGLAMRFPVDESVNEETAASE